MYSLVSLEFVGCQMLRKFEQKISPNFPKICSKFAKQILYGANLACESRGRKSLVAHSKPLLEDIVWLEGRGALRRALISPD